MVYRLCSVVGEQGIAHSAMLLISIGLPLALACWLNAPWELTLLICLPGILAESSSAAALFGKALRRR
jgi:hypothetical protein